MYTGQVRKSEQLPTPMVFPMGSGDVAMVGRPSVAQMTVDGGCLNEEQKFISPKEVTHWQEVPGDRSLPVPCGKKSAHLGPFGKYRLRISALRCGLLHVALESPGRSLISSLCH